MSAVTKLDLKKPKRELYTELARIGAESSNFAFAPYSDYSVGCAGLMFDGRVYPGVNTENTGIHLTIHGEMSVVNAAIADGVLEDARKAGFDESNFIRAVAVIPKRSFEAWPCGHCRDFLSGFGQTMDIIVHREDGGVLWKPLSRVLPFAAAPEQSRRYARTGSLLSLVSGNSITYPNGQLPVTRLAGKKKRDLYGDLLACAFDAGKLSYAPYTKCPAGAAVLLHNNAVYPGCRVENVGYTLSCDPEQAAIHSAIGAGELDRHIASGGKPSDFIKAVAYAPLGQPNTWPCGASRQAMCDFGLGIDVVVSDHSGLPIWNRLSKLLPGAFVPDVLSYWTRG